MIGKGIAICVAALVLFYPRAAVAQQVKLSFEAGRVTLDARDATIREVLDEWARRGNVIVANAGIVGDRRVSLQLDEVLEREALEAVLGGVAGYVITEREPGTAGPAIFGRLFVVAQSELRAVAPSAARMDAAALTPPDGALTNRLPPESTDPIRASDTALDQASGSQISVANAEPPDGRPDAARPASTGMMEGRSAAAGGTRGNSTVVEPPDGRAFDARPTGPRSAPAPAAAPARSTIGEPKDPVTDVKNAKDANGREVAK